MLRIDNAHAPVSIEQPTSGSIGRIEAHADAPPALPDPMHSIAVSGDAGAMIAALLVESGKASRETSRKARDAAAASEAAAHEKKISHMESAATQKLVGGIASGASQIGSAGAMIGGELRRNVLVKDSANGIEGHGKVASAVASFLAANEDVEVAHADRALTQAKRSVESADESVTDAKDLLRRAMSYYADYVSAKDSAQKAALFRA